eukprot:6174829-Pyramimonas_sp.AAC.1
MVLQSFAGGGLGSGASVPHRQVLRPEQEESASQPPERRPDGADAGPDGRLRRAPSAFGRAFAPPVRQGPARGGRSAR